MIRKVLLVISLSLLVGTVGLWVVSYSVAVGAYGYSGKVNIRVGWSYGVVQFSYQLWTVDMKRSPRFAAFMDAAQPLTHYGLLHFKSPASRPAFSSIVHTAACPAWTLVLLLACPTALLARAIHRQRYRRRHNLCVKCGYSLEGNESGVCPECGTPAAMTVATHESTEKQ